jgi:K+-transporting ATPase KdpF subunit
VKKGTDYSAPTSEALKRPTTAAVGRAVCPLFHTHSNRRRKMDYIIAGIAAIFLFAYLLYALLKPEKF